MTNEENKITDKNTMQELMSSFFSKLGNAPKANPADLEKYLSTALDYYKEFGLELTKRPKVVYLDEIYNLNENVSAMAMVEIDIQKALSDLVSDEFSQLSWKNVYGLEISKEASREINEITKSRFFSIEPEKYKDIDADVVFFNKLLNHSEKEAEAIMVHEVFHLLENQHNVLQNTKMISEGAATFAESLFLEYGADIEIEDCESHYEMIYAGGANLVYKYVKGMVNPYITLLDLDLRKEMQDEFLQRFIPSIMKCTEKILQNPDYGEAVSKQMLEQVPELSVLRDNVTKESLLKFYSAIGAEKFVEEIRSQDMSKLVELYEAMFNHPKK